MAELKELKVGATVWYKSFGKWHKGVITKIVPTDQREVKLTPDYMGAWKKNVSVKAENVFLKKPA